MTKILTILLLLYLYHSRCYSRYLNPCSRTVLASIFNPIEFHNRELNFRRRKFHRSETTFDLIFRLVTKFEEIFFAKFHQLKRPFRFYSLHRLDLNIFKRNEDVIRCYYYFFILNYSTVVVII